jgi:hypothetical protein
MIGLESRVELGAIDLKPGIGPPLLAGVRLPRPDQPLIGVDPVSWARKAAKTNLGQ